MKDEGSQQKRNDRSREEKKASDIVLTGVLAVTSAVISADRQQIDEQQVIIADKNVPAVCETYNKTGPGIKAPDDRCEDAKKIAAAAAERAAQSKERTQNAMDAMEIAAGLPEEKRKNEDELVPKVQEDKRAAARNKVRELFEKQNAEKARNKQTSQRVNMAQIEPKNAFRGRMKR